MVGVTKIQRASAGYWLAAVAQGGDDYYTKPGEAPGEWVGQLAAEMELFGQVDAAGYTAILEGRDPRSGAELLRRPATRVYTRPDGSERRAEPVLGYDVRFSAPKSVSLLYALGDAETRQRVIGILGEAVRAGMAHLEAEACVVQRGRAGKTIERGEGFVGMAFRHRMSRAGDPALHVHVVVSNLTRAASDGKWLTLASPRGRSPLWPHGKSAGVVFQAALRAGFLREFGLEFGQVTNGYADLHGFPREAIDALSVRSREIATWMELHGVTSTSAAQTAAYRTRARKDYGVDVDRRREEWVRQLEPHGLTPASVTEMTRSARPREPRALSGTDIDAALAKLEQTSSHFDRRAVLWALADQLPEGADLPTLTAAVDHLLASERVICVHQPRDLLDQPHYTTPRLAELERRFIEGALGGSEAAASVLARPAVELVLERHPYLGADQREMALRIATSAEQVIPVSAWPGTGKTTALRAVREGLEGAGFDVIGVASARTASGELKKAGIPSATSIRDLLIRAERWQADGIQLRRGTVLIVDEASTASTIDLEQLRSLVVACAGKLVLIGDARQIGAIGPGGLYAHLTRLVEPVKLQTIRRQHREPDRELVTLVHEGRGSEALDLLRTQGRLIVGDDLPSTLRGLLADWHRDFATGADVVMIARRNRDVTALNEAARALRAAEGKLGRLQMLVGDTPIAVGDRVQTRINAACVSNRERWEVVRVNPLTRRVRLRSLSEDRREVKLDPSYLKRRTPEGAPALQHAYAITKFGSQAQTYDRVYPLLDATSGLEEELVALSRGREVANVYAVAASEFVDPDLGPVRRELSDELHDVREAIEREGADYAAAEVALRHRVESMPGPELAERRAALAGEGHAPDPELLRRERLDRAIVEAREAVEHLADERAAIETRPEPPAGELAWAHAAEVNARQSLAARQPEREALEPVPQPTEEPQPTEPQQRLEAIVIEERIANLARREVTAARLDSSEIIYKTLGPFPAGEPAKALAWGRGANAIAMYRQRYGVRDPDRALGRQPHSAAARAERERARRTIEAARHQLGRSQARAAERSAAKGLAIGR